MFDRHDDRTINVLVDEVLNTLRTNLVEHRTIVAEARKGYVEAARKELEKRLAQLAEGKIVSLEFRLSPPQDHSQEFLTAIKMMEMHKAAHEAVPGNETAIYQFKAMDVQRLMLNEWSWMDSFLLSNSQYSETSTRLAAEKGLL